MYQLIYEIPIKTFKDRVKGHDGIDTFKSGPQTMYSQEEEAFLAKHLITMTQIGFGYSREETNNSALAMLHTYG